MLEQLTEISDNWFDFEEAQQKDFLVCNGADGEELFRVDSEGNIFCKGVVKSKQLYKDCDWCGSMSPDDIYGNCSACGGTR